MYNSCFDSRVFQNGEDLPFRVGDLVRIRDWNDMKQEYGMNDDCIEVPGMSFVPYMRKYCGTKRVIVGFYNENGVVGVNLSPSVEWFITPDMIEHFNLGMLCRNVPLAGKVFATKLLWTSKRVKDFAKQGNLAHEMKKFLRQENLMKYAYKLVNGLGYGIDEAVKIVYDACVENARGGQTDGYKIYG